jgi:hypothetical protein
MLLSDFEASLASPSPPEELSAALTALWLDRKGEFDRAHAIAQDIPGAEGASIHAYLHRKEGDEDNARYWYRRAGAEMPSESLESEWKRLVCKLTR